MKSIFVIFLILFTVSCGWHTRGNNHNINIVKNVSLISNDPNGPLSRAVRNQLRLNGFNIVDNTVLSAEAVTSLRLGEVIVSKDTASVYQDGQASEYQYVMTVNASVLIPDKDLYPLTVRILKSSYSNPYGALKDSAAQDIFISEMYRQVAEKLVRRFVMMINPHS